MKKETEDKTVSFVDKNRKERFRKQIVRLLACIVVVCTIYSLVLPAITLRNNQVVYDCTFSVHQHTNDCYNDAHELICGKVDYVIHTHDDNCYDGSGNLLCTLEERVIHSHSDECYEVSKVLVCENSDESHVHSDECYEVSKVLICENSDENHIHSDECYEIEKELICKEQATLHTHIESCYGENGVLVCGMFEVKEHVHTNSCFTTVNTHVDENLSNTTEETSGTDNPSARPSGDTWGYNDDKSIWWETSEFGIVDTIEEGIGYYITGYQGNTLMTNEEIDVTPNCHGIKAVPTQHDTNYQLYEYWYFEKATGTNNYYIYCKNSDNQTKYLQLTTTNPQTGNNETAMLYLVNEKEQASIFTVVKGSSVTNSNYPDLYLVYVEIDGSKLYIDSYYGDDKYNTTHYGVYSQVGEGTHLKISRHDVSKIINTARPIETNESINSVINLFDYWTTANRSDRDDSNANLYGGINQGHDFKFSLGNQCPENQKINRWTGHEENPLQGIVANTLGDSGYPRLSGNSEINGITSNESLEYLFNPKMNHAGKQSFTNVTGLLDIDQDGYYSFDADKNMAEFDEETYKFTVYDHIGVPVASGGSFFPFNVAPEIMNAAHTDYRINHYFGMSLSTRFVQRHGGHTNEKRNQATTFNFSGDDDVWIFIDGVLVGDAGGIHDACDLSIDFSTGKVSVKVTVGNQPKLETTLHDCYEKAGKLNATTWAEVNNTEGQKEYIFADNTLHSLKFYFLERGNYESNLRLTYNLTDIPHTSIHKTDQYGNPVEGVDFSVYAANENYQMLDGKGGSPVNLDNVTWEYDKDNNIKDSNGNIIAKVLYNGTTNRNGELIFTDEYEMPLTIDEIENMFGKNFILRETQMPSGYRWVSEDCNLSIWHSQATGQKYLQCDNVSESGTRASVTLQVTATDTLQLTRPYNGSKYPQFNNQSEVVCCDDQGNPKGVLFAVLHKYTGATDGSEVSDTSKWDPVWGIDKDGYTVVPVNIPEGASEQDEMKAGIKAALEAAKINAEKYGYRDIVFTPSASGSLQLYIDNLPGDVNQYYLMLDNANKNKARYTVTYFWTDQDKLSLANENNTYRVYTYKGSSNERYSAFDRVFGANIYVPNLDNIVLVQKQSEIGRLVDGATFGIYPVKQEADGTIWATAVGGDKVKFPKKAIPQENGDIIYVDKHEDGSPIVGSERIIKPIEMQVTRTYDEGGNKDLAFEGTAKFDNVPVGEYIVKEVDPPSGFKINPADVMLRVDKDMIYANAGTEDDKVMVGRGTGYLVNPLTVYGSIGNIDVTLSWMYARMLISGPSTRFSDATSVTSDWGYLTKNMSGEKVSDESQIDKALISYLQYANDHVQKFNGLGAYNYLPNAERIELAKKEGKNPTTYRRLFTTVGWNHYAILQDYEYGKEKAAKLNANYRDWSNRNLMHLFSRSTYIMVGDERMGNRLILKTIDANDGRGVANARFRLYKINKDNTKQYYQGYNSTDDVAIWSTSEANAQITTSGDDGVAPQYFDGLDEATYYLEEVKKPDNYLPITKPIKLKYEKNIMTLDSQGQPGPYDITDGYFDETTELFTFKATLPYYMNYRLPETGGDGITQYIGWGLLLLGGASLILVFKKKLCNN